MIGKMKSALLYGIGDMRVVEVDIPKVGPEDVLIKVKACAVCPTNLRYYRSKGHWQPAYPVNQGHEYTGDIAEVGEKVTHLKVGMRVVGPVIGGGFADYALVKGELTRMYKLDCLEIPENTSYEEATFMEPLADCIHAVVDQAQVKLGDTLAVVGAGPMGLQQMMLAKLSGATVIMGDLVQERVDLAEKFGADHVINASKSDPVKAVKELTKGKGADAVIVTIGHPVAINQGLSMAKSGGRVVIFGGAPLGTTVPLDPNVIHYGEIILTGSSGIGKRMELFPMALEIIASKKVRVGGLITHHFPLDQIHEAFETVEQGKGLKAMVIP